MERRDRTTIKIQILKSLYLKGQAGIYSGKLGGLIHEVCTNHYTFSKALKELKEEGLVRQKMILIGRRSILVVQLTEEGRQLLTSSLPLINRF